MLIRQEAEEQVKKIKQDAEQKIAEAKAQNDRQSSAACTALKNSILRVSDKQAYQLLAHTKKQLADKLHVLARAMLSDMRNNDYGQVFHLLAAELPNHSWQQIRVHPDDVAIAAQLFPNSKIITDQSISGGFVASGDGGGLVIINTLEKRLERAWPFILPKILKDVLATLDHENIAT